MPPLLQLQSTHQYVLAAAHDTTPAVRAQFFWFFLFLYLNFCVLTFFGIMSINLMPDVQLGTVLVAFFFTMWNLLCGFLIAGPVSYCSALLSVGSKDPCSLCLCANPL